VASYWVLLLLQLVVGPCWVPLPMLQTWCLASLWLATAAAHPRASLLVSLQAVCPVLLVPAVTLHPHWVQLQHQQQAPPPPLTGGAVAAVAAAAGGARRPWLLQHAAGGHLMNP
jgi:hypothetical protein